MVFNVERRNWALAGVNAHRRAKGEEHVYDDPIDVATDLLTDLCHYIYHQLREEPHNMKSVEAENEVQRLVNDRCFDGFLEELQEENDENS